MKPVLSLGALRQRPLVGSGVYMARLLSVPSLSICSAEDSTCSPFLGVFRAEALSSPWPLGFLMAEELEDSQCL
jgi:hypothetical protein